MIKKTITLVFVLLMMSPIFMTPQTTNTSTFDFTPVQKSQVAETDLNRVTWEADVAPNGDFEAWSTPLYPGGLAATRTTEKATWFETSVVNEGSRAIGMHAKSLDGVYEAEVRLTQQAWIYWDNPINTTIDLDWYLDEIGTPLNSDEFRMQVRMSNRYLNYYLGSQTTLTNSTSTGHIMIEGPTQTWNHLHRNLTSDYFAVFGLVPTRFELIYWWVRSETTEYTRAFMDDVNLVNGSYVHVGGSILNGNFEGTGGWTFQSSSDPADISQSSLSHGGSWSMNMTAISHDYSSRATARANLEKRLSPINKGQLSFYWRIDDWVNPALGTIASMKVTVQNSTTSVSMYYYLCIGGAGTLPFSIFSSDMKFFASAFNVTDTWNHFDRNIWDDFHIFSNTDELFVDDITFTVRANEDDSRLSVLFDDMSLEASIMNDMSYETQGAVGTPIEGWNEPSGDPAYSVTDFAFTGSRAGNMTVEDDQDFYEDQPFGNLQIDETTELFFDFNVYLEAFNESSEDFIYFEFHFGDGETIAYVIANATDTYESWLDEGTNIIFLQNTIVTGEWMNFQLDLVHDYESAVGSSPDTTVVEVYLVGLASKSSKLVAYFDDLYIYYDPAPEITSVDQTPALVEEAGELVEITAEVIDGSDVTVTLSYRVDSGAWINVTMDETTIGNYTVDINAPWGETEYFITAEDAFDKTDTALDGGDYFTFTTADTVGPIITLSPTNGSTVSDIVTIEITVNDGGSGFASGNLFIEGASITNVSYDYVDLSWDTTVIANGEYNITVVASDNAGNTATITHLVTVENAGAPADLSGVILIVVIVAIIGGIAVIYIFILKKK